MTNRDFDLIVFGAAGCTGRFVVEEFIKFLNKNPNLKITWAIAGLNEDELVSVLQEVSDLTGIDCTTTEIVIADATNLTSSLEMAGKCDVVINCVGPFRFLGENVVKACIAQGTHLIEAAGEVQYLLKIQLLYHDMAVERGTYIISSVGFASVPADCGTVFLQQNFSGDLNSVEIFFEPKVWSRKIRKGNYASFRSMMYISCNLSEWERLERQILTGKKINHQYPVEDRGIIHYNRDVSSWCMFNPQCDTSVVRRSQHYFQQKNNATPVQVKSYLKLPSLLACLATTLATFLFAGLCQFKLCRYLLEKFPKIFSLGACDPNKKLDREVVNSIGFKFIIVGRGWADSRSVENSDGREAPNKIARLEISGYNPAYGASAIMLIQAALTLLQEKNNLPKRGGVYPPGAAFANTTYVQRLNSNGVKFDLIK